MKSTQFTIRRWVATRSGPGGDCRRSCAGYRIEKLGGRTGIRRSEACRRRLSHDTTRPPRQLGQRFCVDLEAGAAGRCEHQLLEGREDQVRECTVFQRSVLPAVLRQSVRATGAARVRSGSKAWARA